MPSAYLTNAAFRFMMDTVDRDGSITLQAIHDVATDPDRPTPAEWMERATEETTRYRLRLLNPDPTKAGEIRVGCNEALCYLMNCDSEARRACVDAMTEHVEADPVRAAIEGGEYGAAFAKAALVARGVSAEDAGAELVVDAMDRVDGMGPADQTRIVARARRNVSGLDLATMTPEEFADE